MNSQSIQAEVGLIDPATGDSIKINVVFTGTERDMNRNMRVIQRGIVMTAGQYKAKDGDTIFVEKTGNQYDYHFKQSAKRFGVGTMGSGILKMCKWIETHSTYTSNELFETVMTSTDRLTAEFICAVAGKMSAELPGCKPITIQNIPKPHSYAGNCYRNAWREYQATGNKPLIVEECCLFDNGLAIIVPHAINYNEATGEYYDTMCDTKVRNLARMAWIIKEGQPLLDWYVGWNDDWEAVEQYANTYGGYDLLWRDDKLITLHTKGIDCDRINEVKSLQWVKIEDYAEWTATGASLCGL